MTHQQILDAIGPLSHLNQWARAPYERQADMYSAKHAIYHMKSRVIRAALDEKLCSLRMVQVERPCKTCKGTGVYERLDYDGEPYTYDDCRRCSSTGKVILRFAETTIEAVRWHTPRPNAQPLGIEAGVWEKCEPTDWEPEQPGREIDRPTLFRLLNEAERAVCGGKMIRHDHRNPFCYSLHFGTIEECFVCGQAARSGHPWYRPDIYRPGMRWKQAVCDGCALRAERWPKQWPVNLFRWSGRWDHDSPPWYSRAPLPLAADSEIVREWLDRRGIVVGQIPPGDHAFEADTETFLEVIAVRQGRALIRVADSRHPAYRYDEQIVLDASSLRGSFIRRIGGAE